MPRKKAVSGGVAVVTLLLIPAVEVVTSTVLLSTVVVLGNCGLCGLLLLGRFTGGNLLLGGVSLGVVDLAVDANVEVIVVVVVLAVIVNLGDMRFVTKFAHPKTLTSMGSLSVEQALGDPEI